MRVHRRSLEQSACANKCMRMVTVFVQSPSPDLPAYQSHYNKSYSSYMIDLVQCFERCEFLKLIALFPPFEHQEEIVAAGRVDIVENACVSLRNRNIAVRVCTIDYMS